MVTDSLATMGRRVDLIWQTFGDRIDGWCDVERGDRWLLVEVAADGQVYATGHPTLQAVSDHWASPDSDHDGWRPAAVVDLATGGRLACQVAGLRFAPSERWTTSGYQSTRRPPPDNVVPTNLCVHGR